MKVAFYISNLIGGGAERNFINIINYIFSRGINVDLILNNKIGQNLKYLDIGVNLYILNSNESKYSIIELRQYIDKYVPNIIISTLTHCNLALLIASLLSHRTPKIVIREANSFLEQRRNMGLLRLFYERLRTSILYRRANLILVNSIGSRDQLSKATMIKKNNIVVLPNSVDINLIRSLAKQRIEPFINQFVKGKKVIVSVGRLVRNKDFSNLIKAFNRLEEKNIVLLILGEGNLEYQLQSLINRLNLEKKILLTGFIDNPYSIVAKSDVFVLSSIFEGMPNSLIEAMVLNIPIVATDCPSGPKEILMDGEHGILVPVNDSKLMADAIINQLCESSRIYPVKADLNKYSNVKVGEYLLIEINRLLS